MRISEESTGDNNLSSPRTKRGAKWVKGGGKHRDLIELFDLIYLHLTSNKTVLSSHFLSSRFL